LAWGIVMSKSVFAHFSLAAISLLAAAPSALADPFLPDFSAATFLPGAPIDNPYFPLIPGAVRDYSGVNNEGDQPVVETDETRVLSSTIIIAGVQAMIVEDRAFEDGVLVEDTFDYYAQDTHGNVWYLGEDPTNYIYDDQGHLIGTNNDGAWRTGVNGDLPGFQMPVLLHAGFNYYQEFAPNDQALDEGTTIDSNHTVTIGLGTFD